MRDLCYLTAVALARGIRNREISSSDVIEALLGRIAARNAALNAVVTLDESGARRRARQADEAVSRGEFWGPLHGVPVTFKDVFETAGLRTTAGHKPLADYVPAGDAAVVARLRAQGAIVLGKTNLPALAMDTQCENPLFGRTNNPWDLARTPGGSSGGEAAAVAAGMTPLGLGSDIGGSVRLPAHYCGVLSLKPTEGRVPQTGHIPPLPGAPNWIRHLVASGPIARSIEDLRLGLEVISRPEGGGPSAPPTEAPGRPLGEHRFAWTDDFGGLPISADTRAAMRTLADELSNAGCRVERAVVRDLDFEQVWKTYGELVGAMLSAGLPLLPRAILRTFGRFVFSKDLLTRSGTRTAMASLKTYFQVLEKRDRMILSIERFLSGYDAWLCPVSSSPAFPHRKMGKINTPIDLDGESIPGHLGAIGYTCPFNLTGNPVVVVPVAKSRGGLPIGVQIVGRRWKDTELLDAATALTRITGPFHRPPGY